MLQIDQLSFAYRSSDRPVIHEISTHLAPGCIAGLLGANGVGKSTLVKLIAGLLNPTSGAISVLNCRPFQRSVKLLETLCLIPEKTWLPDMSSAAYARLYSPLYPNFDHQLFSNCVERFELPHPKNLQDYSYGQQKKFLLAFGIASRAKLFILDEPTNGLDIPSKEQFRQILLETIEEDQSAIISTHQAHDLQGMIDTAMLMDDKQLLTLSMEDLSNTFSMEKFAEKPANALYGAQNFNEWLCLVPYLESSQREIDLELLFSAFHLNKSTFLKHLDALPHNSNRASQLPTEGENDAL